MDPKHHHFKGEGVFKDRRQALEEAFFAKRERELREQRMAAQARESTEEALSEATGIDNPKLLGRLIEQGVTADTLVALSLIPLVAIAWADEELEEEEKQAILDAAAEAGISADSSPGKLLEAWMAHPPAPDLVATWRDYVQSLIVDLDDDEVEELRKEVLDRAHDVAFAAGGFLGIGAVNWMEKRKLDELADAFARPQPG